MTSRERATEIISAEIIEQTKRVQALEACAAFTPMFGYMRQEQLMERLRGESDFLRQLIVTKRHIEELEKPASARTSILFERGR